MTDTHKKLSQDEELSDFADRVLKGQTRDIASGSNEELRQLEETILRLHSVMPSSPLEESTKKQMLVRLNARIRKEQSQKKSLWGSIFDTDWLQNQSRSQFAAVAGIIALLLVAVVISPTLGTGGDSSPITGTAFTGSYGIILPFVLFGLIILILWIKRKK
jgi:hypothetical protein